MSRVHERVLVRLPTGKEYYYLPRELYSVAALTDETGMIVEAATYDTYGQVAVYDGAAQVVDQSPVGNPYYFTGRRLDLLPLADGLKQAYHYRGREYDPGNGRFMQRDPLQYVDGMSLHEYVSSEPAGLVDPYGWKKDTPLWIRAANLAARFSQLWEIYSEKIPDDDPGKAKAQTLMRHYVYGLGRLFAETWDGFMEDRPELQEAIRPVLEAEAARLCASNAHGATGKINLRTSAKLNQLMSMRLTLHGGQVTITDDWKVLQPPGTAACPCRVTFTNVKYTWHDRGDMHPGTETELEQGEYVDDSVFMGFGKPFDIRIYWYADAELEVADGKATWLSGWPGAVGATSKPAPDGIRSSW